MIESFLIRRGALGQFRWIVKSHVHDARSAWQQRAVFVGVSTDGYAKVKCVDFEVSDGL